MLALTLLTSTEALLSAPRLPAADAETAPKVIKIPALIEAIKQHKGKVVIVDCWADG
jgi:uncharacterized protein (DUF362 family)